MSIYDRVFRNCIFSNTIALKILNTTITYHELCSYIKYLANKLCINGLRVGDKVLILLPNCQEFIISFFAITYVGGIPVLVDIKMKDEICIILRENKIKLIVTDDDGASKVNIIWDKLKQEKNFETLQEVNIITNEQLLSLYRTPLTTQDVKNLHIASHINLDAPAMILYTSGSTGQPKGIINSHRTLEEALNNYLSTFPMTQSDRLVAVTPFFHSYTFGSCMLSGLASGGTLLLRDIFQPRQILKLITNEQATIFHGVPYMYNLINQHYNPREHCLDSLRFCVSAGAPLSEYVAKTFYSLTGKIIHQEYGSSETGTIALNLSDNLELNINSVGCSLKNVKVRILEEMNEGMGLISVKSAGQSVGYIGKTPFERDWYTTGDIGILDKNGYIYILGRKNRIINIAGLKVNPVEVEMQLLKYPGIIDVMVRGIKHDDFGEIIEAIIVANDDSLCEDELLGFCRKHLALYKVPKIVNFVDSISKSSLGKVIF